MVDDLKDSQQFKARFNDINHRLEILQAKFLDIAKRAKNLVRVWLLRRDACQFEDVRKRIGLD